MKIAGREIGPGQPPYIIAEVSANHGGSLDRALQMIVAAKGAGADAVKFQAYEADTITLDCDAPDFRWHGRRLYDLYKECQTPFAWFPVLAERARQVGITWFASAFDPSAVDLVVKLDVPAIKIASFELVDLPLIRYAAKTGKPIILSTGMASYNEIGDALLQIQAPYDRTAILHCVSGYPTPLKEASLARLQALRKWWRDPIGISDHTTGIEVPIAATALGACMIEKHFTLDRESPTADSLFSLEPDEFKRMAEAVRDIWTAMRADTAAVSQAPSRRLRRSLYVVKDMRAGDLFTAENVRSIRPGHGLEPAEIDDVLGKPAMSDIARGTALTWRMVGD